MSTNPSQGAIRKSVHRTTSEVPLKISESRTKILRHSLPIISSRSDGNKNIPFKVPSQTNTSPTKNKYHTPELNTSIDLNRKMEKIKSNPISSNDLTPRTKALFAYEATKKLNFPPDKTVYKNLIPINVNDSVLMISSSDDNDNERESKRLRKKYIIKTNKDPIPELSDFLKPIKPLEHKLPPYDKPDILRKPKNNFYPLIYKICTEFHPSY